MGNSYYKNLVFKPERELTEFSKYRHTMGMSQRAMADEIGVSPTVYAQVEEGVYPICGMDNNPKVKLIADFMDIPMVIAESEAHKNLESGYHVSTVMLSPHKYNKKGTSDKRATSKPHKMMPKPDVVKDTDDTELDDVELDDVTELMIANPEVFKELIDSTSVGMDDSFFEHKTGITIANPTPGIGVISNYTKGKEIADTIRSELYGVVDFGKFINISDMLNELTTLL